MKNIVLIGMPGSGKTTVGEILARRLQTVLLDTDEMVVERDGRRIPQIFAYNGEEAFRSLEHWAAVEAGKLSGAVVATGGGLILRQDNIDALAPTGVFVFLDRPPEAIADEEHSGRPLIGSDREKVFKLYAERIPLYKKYAQYTISDPSSPEAAADDILDQLKKAGELQ